MIMAHQLAPLVLLLHHEMVLIELMVKGLLLMVMHLVVYRERVWRNALVRDKASWAHRLRHARVLRHAARG